MLEVNYMEKEIKDIASLLDALKTIKSSEDTIKERYTKKKFLKELKKLKKSTTVYKKKMMKDFFEKSTVDIYKELMTIQNYLNQIKFDLFRLPEFEHSERNKYQLFYRGHGKSSYKLEPKVFRDDEHFKKEHFLYKEIQVRNADRFLTGSGRLELLTTMQHYGLPTRLLDMSASPLVALYFAISSNANEEGELIVFHIPKSEIKYFDSDTVEILTALSSLKLLEKLDLAQLSLQMIRDYAKDIIKSSSKIEDAKKFKEYAYDQHLALIKKYNQKSVVKKLNNEVEKEYGIHLGEINPFDLFSIVPVQPKQTNERIIRQQGAFIAYGLMSKEVARQLTEEYLYRESGKIVRYLIPGKVKSALLEDLERLGINAATIYPELDKVADYLAK